MKKIINKVFLLLLVVLSFVSCNGLDKKEAEVRTPQEILDEVSLVQAVGKVSPAQGWVIVSAPITARIEEVLVADGDTVAAGQVLFLLQSNVGTQELEMAKAKLNGLRQESKGSREELEKAKLATQELLARYRTSEKLYAQRAETREKMEEDYSNWQQQELAVRALEFTIRSQQEKEVEQQIQVEKEVSLLADYQIAAASSGVLVELDAKLGQSVSNGQELAKIVDFEDPIVLAEVDELFADAIQVGQEVLLSSTGRKGAVAQGRVTYVSPILTDKSILYELANEGKDRRVRKVKISLDAPVNLPINAKVDCQIKIR